MIRGVARPSIPPLQPPPCALVMIAGGTGKKQHGAPLQRVLRIVLDVRYSGVTPMLAYARDCRCPQTLNLQLPMMSVDFTFLLRECYFGGVLLWCGIVFADMLRVISFPCYHARSFGIDSLMLIVFYLVKRTNHCIANARALMHRAGGSATPPIFSAPTFWTKCKRTT